MDLVEPVTHRFKAYFLIPDLSLYYKIIAIYNNRKDTDFSVDGVYGDELSGSFKSKHGGLISPTTGNLAFEYIIKVHSPEHARKFTFRVSPLFGPDTITSKGNRLGLDVVGTQLDLTCSYYDLPEMLKQFKLIFSKLRINPAIIDTIDYEATTIIECERHIRYEEGGEAAVGDLLSSMDDLSQSSGNAKGEIKYDHRFSKVFYKAIKFDRWDNIFAKIKRAYSLKSYRKLGFQDLSPVDPLYQPKIEAYFAPEYSETKPCLKMYDEVIHELDTILLNSIKWLNLSPVYDSYFVPGTYDSGVDFIPYPFDAMMHKDEKTLNLASKYFSIRDWDFFVAVSKGYSSPIEIADLMGVSLSSVYNYVKKYRELGLIHLNGGAVSYVSNFIQQKFKESFQGIGSLRSLLSDSSSLDGMEDIRVEISKNDPEWFLKKYGAHRNKQTPVNIYVPDPTGELNHKAVKKDYDEYVKQWSHYYPDGYDPDLDEQPIRRHMRGYGIERHLHFTRLVGNDHTVPVHYVPTQSERSKLITVLRKKGDFAKVVVTGVVTGTTGESFNTGVTRTRDDALPDSNNLTLISMLHNYSSRYFSKSSNRRSSEIRKLITGY